MNKIELTPEQVERLFEMIKHFYKNDVQSNHLSEKGNVLFASHHDDDKMHYVEIHWFELCMTYLSKNIIFALKKPLYHCKDTHLRLLDQTMKMFFQEDKFIHPVDFLYTEFLKNDVNKDVEAIYSV